MADPDNIIDLRDRAAALLTPPVGFVFSGGASGAAAQVGMLAALDGAGIRPDLVVGSSAGAINASIVAARPDDAWLRLTAIWRGLRRSDVITTPGLGLVLAAFGLRREVSRRAALVRLLRRHLPARRFDELTLPLVTMVTEASSGRPVAMRGGSLESALVASSAMPGVLPPVKVRGSWYVDGSISANIPVRQAVEAGAASLVVLDAGPARPGEWHPRRLSSTVQHTMSIMARHRSHLDLALVADKPVLYLANPLGGAYGPFDFTHSEELIDAGRDHGADLLRRVRCDGPGLHGDDAPGGLIGETDVVIAR